MTRITRFLSLCMILLVGFSVATSKVHAAGTQPKTNTPVNSSGHNINGCGGANENGVLCGLSSLVTIKNGGIVIVYSYTQTSSPTITDTCACGIVWTLRNNFLINGNPAPTSNIPCCFNGGVSSYIWRDHSWITQIWTGSQQSFNITIGGTRVHLVVAEEVDNVNTIESSVTQPFFLRNAGGPAENSLPPNFTFTSNGLVKQAITSFSWGAGGQHGCGTAANQYKGTGWSVINPGDLATNATAGGVSEDAGLCSLQTNNGLGLTNNIYDISPTIGNGVWRGSQIIDVFDGTTGIQGSVFNAAAVFSSLIVIMGILTGLGLAEHKIDKHQAVRIMILGCIVTLIITSFAVLYPL